MSVNPGFAGQKFIPSALKKIKDARRLIDSKGLKIELEIDGGVKIDNAGEISKAGADIIVPAQASLRQRTIKKPLQRCGRQWGDQNPILILAFSSKFLPFLLTGRYKIPLAYLISSHRCLSCSI